MNVSYKSSVRLQDDYARPGHPVLDIEVQYSAVATKADEKSARQYFQWRFSRKAGRRVPQKEIVVSPTAGQLYNETTFFRVLPKRPLPLIVRRLQKKAPYTLPRLLEELESAKTAHPPGSPEARLLTQAIDGLAKLVSE